MDIPERAGKKKSPAEIRRFLSSYAVLPYLLTVLMNFIAYYGAKLAYLILDANGRLVYHDLTIAAVDGYFERNASHFRWFIIIYIFYFIFWFAGYWIIAGEERENAHSVFAAAIIGMTVCMICFILLPTTLDRPVL